MTTQHFAVLHRIHDAAGWARILSSEHSWPESFDLRSFVEAEDRRLAICVWAAPSRDELQHSLDDIFGQVAVNEVHRVLVHRMERTESST